MNRRNLLTLAGVAAATVNVNAASLTGIDRAIEHGDRTREYRLYVPSGLDREKPAPLVFALHGGGGNAAREEGRVAYNEYAERDGWIVIYPNGVDGHWNDLRGYEGFVSHREDVDDVGLIEALLNELRPMFMFRLGTIDPVRMQESQRPGGKPAPSLHAAFFWPVPRPTIETGVKSMTAAVLELMNKGVQCRRNVEPTAAHKRAPSPFCSWAFYGLSISWNVIY